MHGFAGSILTLGFFLLHICLATESTEDGPRVTATISLWPHAQTTASAWKEVIYDTATLQTIDTRTIREARDIAGPDDETVRVGLDKDVSSSGSWIADLAKGKEKRWIGVSASRDALVGSKASHALLSIHVARPSSEVTHVGYSSWTVPGEKGASSEGPIVDVEVRAPVQGPTPLLNRPVVLTPEGKFPEQEEKTLWQRYWWVFIGMAVVAFAGSGGGGE